MTARLKRTLVIALSLALGAGVLAFLLLSTPRADAQVSSGGGGGSVTSGGASAPAIGDMIGWAWGATTVAPYGGMGWLNFSCKTAPGVNPCAGAAGAWGTHVDVTLSATGGELSGYAWSNNLGWLAFGSAADTCLTNGENDSPGFRAKVTNLSNIGAGLRIVGWAKFIAADADPNDGWDGCVSFSHVPRGGGTSLYQTTVDYTTGSVGGYAFGDDVVGWVSFDCNNCDVNIIFQANQPDIDFWSDATSVASGGGTTLHWQATSDVPTCNAYSNSRNYLHWRKVPMGSGSQPQQISQTFGNLPSGSWPVSNITQTVTYQLTCQDRNGVNLPIQYVTVTVGRVGCMDPLATNYDPTATVAGPCTYGGGPTVTLTATTNFPGATMPAGGTTFDHQVGLYWTFTNPSQVAPQYCDGTLRKNGGSLLILPAWTDADLAYTNSFGTNNLTSLLGGAVNGDIFTFTITCTDVNGNPFSGSADVTITGSVTPSSPTLVLTATPNVVYEGSGAYTVGLTWQTSPANQLDSCEASDLRLNLVDHPLANWTDGLALPDPDYTTPWQVNLGSSVSAGDTFIFEITCMDGSTPVEATAVVNIAAPTFTPSINLSIPSPNNFPATIYSEEISPAGFNPMNFAWNATDVDTNTCVPHSEQYPDGSTYSGFGNPDWDGGSFVSSLTGSHNLNMSVSNPLGPTAVIQPTIFWIECDSLGGGTVSSNIVCVSVNGIPFPACSVPNTGNIPTYKEI